jgi:alginate O-acetyltransferase complex protein AlgI
MAFTSIQFIFIFLPLAFLGFAVANRFGGTNAAITFLGLVSLLFYGLFGWKLLCVLLFSLALNFAAGQYISKLNENRSLARNVLLGAVAADLGILGYLKYSNFFIDVVNQVTGSSASHLDIAIPIGVSFFTFVQIGYLIDAYNGQLSKHDFSRYLVFTAFFPAVTAGPLVMQREMMEQLNRGHIDVLNPRRILIGLTMFAMGLFKKVVLADSIAPFADSVFGGVHNGLAVDTLTAWTGAVCYALQLYFDFSGYSDMAIGLATLFAIKLPLNFDSPFKATNISDFWRRWHMTMTRFFTAYIYSGLAMSGMRKSMSSGAGRLGKFLHTAAIPSLITFVVAGVWHGSGWTFVIYGVMHGTAVASYLAWREFSGTQLPRPVAWLLTMVTVVCALVMFRAADVPTALAILGKMWGFAGTSGAAEFIILDEAQALSMIVIMGAITLLLPNTQQILHHEWPVVDTKPKDVAMSAGLVAWRPSFRSAFAAACVFAIGITSIGSSTGFLYYKF